jgi:hypothetical protein
MIRTQVQIEEEQAKWLKAKSIDRGVSISQLIREALDLYRAHEDRRPEEKRRRAIAAIGRFSSGISDVSERHDEYLTEAFQEGGRNGD